MPNIKELNPWWDHPTIQLPERNFKQRFIHKEIGYFLDKKFMISLSGLRRLGKTTVFRQLIQQCLDAKKDPTKVFFYEFSDSDTNLEKVLHYYFHEFLNANLYDLECYIFLDELQYVKKWQVTLKYYYDINPLIRFFVSGSSSLLLHEDTKESLAGRIFDFTIQPMGFHEYLYMKNSVTFPSFDLLKDDMQEHMKGELRLIDLYKHEFNEYLRYGEFPQITTEKLFTRAKEYLSETVLDKIFNKDIRVFQVDKLRELRLLYKIINQTTAQFINKTNIAREVSLSRDSVTSYIEILKKAFLMNYSYNYLRSIASQEKSYKKAYVTSINLLMATLNIDDINDYVYPDFKGHLIETYVYNRLNYKYRNCLYFFNKDKKEVDIVIEKGLSVLPIEVKIKSELKDHDFRHLYNFMEKHKLNRGVFVYGGKVAERTIHNKHFTLIPYYLLD